MKIYRNLLTRLNQNIKRKSLGKFLNECEVFNSLDELPIWNFKKVQDTADLRYLINLKDYKNLPLINQKFLNKLNVIWEDLEIQYYDKIGIEENFKRYISDQKELLISTLENIIEEDEFKLTLHEILEHKFNEKYNKSNQEVNFDENLAILESYYSFPIDIKKTSCTKYFTYIKTMKKRIEKENNNG